MRLNQVLINLVGNAIKFTSQGDIEVGVQLLNEENGVATLQFSVRDSGIGLDETQCRELFKAFTQADSSITRRYGGTGLGLAISKRLVELMGGKIWVESEPGQGSTFFFTVQLEMQSPMLSEHQEQLLELQGLKILIVDDNSTARVIVRSMLESLRFTCEEASSGPQALRMLREPGCHYDLILMDWQMPGMDGIETCRRIRHWLTPEMTPPIVMVSAHGREELMRQAENTGILAYLMKPVSPSLLFDSIMEALGKPLRTAASHDASPDQDVPTSDFLAGKKILLVEDNEINQEVATGILQSAGLDITISINGREAIDLLNREAAQGNYFDAVLMDCQMPVLDGYSATRELRRDANFSTLPIIAMTANAMSGDREKCMAAGMNDHVAKPINCPELFRTLERWILARPGSAPAADHAGEATAQPRGTSPLESLPGVNLREGLNRVGNDITFYERILRKFVSSQGDAVSKLRSALESGGRAEAIHLAHTLKGVSANLGAQAISESSHRLERALQDGHPDLTPELEDLESHLQPLIAAVQSWQQSENPPSGSATDLNPEAAWSALESLSQALHNDDPTASKHLDVIRPYCQGSQAIESMATASAALERFDFPAALAELPNLRACLDGVFAMQVS